ncbi:MAG TPA: SAM-dependent methyltransferase [Acidimicrobiales bacterium]|nr:SAM-dependent methyltransferase [Acidimicrobiales bacterium]
MTEPAPAARTASNSAAATHPVPPREPPEIDTSVAHAARVYDYLLGGTDNFAVDRAAAEAQLAAMGNTLEKTRAEIQANRAFLGRAVRYLAREAGIRQFLDLGTGIPNADNVHAVAQQVAPDARIVYVDNDPLVLAYAHSLLQSTPQGAAAYIDGDLRSPESVLAHAAATLDLAKPVAVMLISLLHLVPDSDDPYGIVDGFMSRMPSGSYLVITQLTKDIQPEAMAALERSAPATAQYSFVMRSHAELSRFFDGLELVEPGVVSVDRWHPDTEPPPGSDAEAVPFYGAVGRKP